MNSKQRRVKLRRTQRFSEHVQHVLRRIYENASFMILPPTPFGTIFGPDYFKEE